MTATAMPDDRTLPPPPSSTADVGYWGMALFVATEATMFAMLVGSYLFLGTANPGWPPPGIERPKLILPPIMTAVLLLSSATMFWAEKGIKRGDRTQLRIGLSVTIVLGLGFLTIQGFEYADKLRKMKPWDHAYAASFYTITSFHALHVISGLLLLGYALLRALLGHFDGEQHLAVKNVGLYWHFVDAVWLVIFTTLYLSPRFY
ncbi:MAG TPA: heme-copper oxidase subunit III [Gemmatimonadaceae bacterium]|nr:heme-copper oxidase subunit III [Gemmatimonadaceae bacterium]